MVEIRGFHAVDVANFVRILESNGVNSFMGVPDSLLSPLCSYLLQDYGMSSRHIIAANEGNAVALAAGYHLATGKVACVYLQNSGLGNIVNPVVSLLSDRVYSIPCVFVIGWRGEPGIPDEPQHVFQGEITLRMLDILDINYMVIDGKSTENEVQQQMTSFAELLKIGKSVAFVIRRGALTYSSASQYRNKYRVARESVIRVITEFSGCDVIISTTGKTSRELFEIREQKKQSHRFDFLTVGSMGHAASIALGIAVAKPHRRVWCIDGDGAALMHLGAMALIGKTSPSNLIHVLINNEAHESVGGQPTAADSVDFCRIAQGCGYRTVYSASDEEQFRSALQAIRDADGPCFVEVKCAIGSRANLGRPTTSPIENKQLFMSYLKEVSE